MTRQGDSVVLPEGVAALIFDFDGTLVLSGDLHFAACEAAAARQGVSMARAFYAARGGMSRTDLAQALDAEAGGTFDQARFIAESLDETMIRLDMVRVNPPVLALVETYAGRTPMAVASNAEGAVVRAILDRLDLARHFRAVVTIDDVARAKPDPEMFLLSAHMLGVSAARCLVFEDSDQGLTAARRAGIPVVDVRGLHGAE